MSAGGTEETRLLERSSKSSFERRGSLLAAAAASRVREPVKAPPGLAFLTTAVLDRRSQLLNLGFEIPEPMRHEVLSASECILARIDPVWAWELEKTLLGEEQLNRWPSLGLDLAARMQSADARQLMNHKLEVNSMFASQMNIEDGVRRRHLPKKVLIEDLTVEQVNPYLAGAGLIDPENGLRLAKEALKTHTPWDLREAFTLIAKSAVSVGRASGVVEQARQNDFIAAQSAWTEAAAASGALNRSATEELVLELAPRVDDELDSGRELLAGMSLLIALAHVGAGDRAALLAANWLVTPPLLVDMLFYAEAPAVIPLDRLFENPPSEWQDLYNSNFCWNATSAEDVRLACEDAMAVCNRVPWRPLPGSLADRINWSSLRTF